MGHRPVRTIAVATTNYVRKDAMVEVDHPEDDQSWDRGAHSETGTERLDRNWSNLLQELRVVQTGVHLLTGFMLTLPFQQRFDVLDRDMRGRTA